MAQGSKITKFDTVTCDVLKHYVYCLVDPGNNEIFYVGKGQNNRVFDHSYKPGDEAKEDADAREKRIADIKKSGREVDRHIVCHGLDDKAAFTVESCVISLLQSNLIKDSILLNIYRGHSVNTNGISSVDDIHRYYGLPLLQKNAITDPVMIVNISRSLYVTAGTIYDAARGDWCASEQRLLKTPGHYVIAEYYGVFMDIFKPKPKSWEVVKNSDGTPFIPKRMRFENEENFKKGNANYNDLFKKYCKKRNGFHKRGDASAFRYFNM